MTTDLFGTGSSGGGDLFGGSNLFGTPGPAPAPAPTPANNASGDLFGSTPMPAPAPGTDLFGAGGGSSDLFGGTPAPAPANGLTANTNTPAPAAGNDIFGGGTDLFGGTPAPAPAPGTAGGAMQFGDNLFNTPAPAPGGVVGLFNMDAPAAAANAGTSVSGGYDVKAKKEKVEYHIPNFLTDIENHFREMGYADGTGGGYQDFTHLYPVDRTTVGKKPLPRTDQEVREAVGEERWKEKSKLLGNTQQIALQYEKGILAFWSSVTTLERNVRTWRKNLDALLRNQLNAVKAKIEKVEIDYLRSYDLQKYLHRRVLVVLANKDLLGAPPHDGPEEAAFNEKVHELAKQIRVTENFRARIEHLQYSQQRQNATKPQYEASIPSDTRRTLISHLQKQKNILAVLSNKVATIKKDMRIIREWQREKREKSFGR